MQNKAESISYFASKTGLRINKKKTEVMKINSRINNPIHIEGHELNTVDRYTYLGANVSIIGGGEEDITNRIHKAMTSFLRLKQIWNSNV